MNEQSTVITYNNNQQKSNSKTILYLIIIGLLLVIIGVAGILLFSGETKKAQSRTIMIYMVGSNLESRSGIASAELAAIDYQKAKEQNVNVVLIAGGAKKWYNDYIDKSETSIFELGENGFTKVKQQDKKNMGKPETLSDFINYVYDNYKTDKYDLLFWNHGGAIGGSEYDELSGDDNLSLTELNNALKDTKFNKDNKLELIFFRTCLNGSIEVANTFKDYADYLVSSEEITYGTPETSELKFINEIQTKDTAKEIGKKFITTYRAELNQMKENSGYEDDESVYSTYSVVDLSKVDQLTESLTDFISSIDVTENFAEISKVRANLLQYGSVSVTYDMIDLYNFVDELKGISPEKAKKVLNTFENTVVYNWATDSRSRGLSIYFPYKGSNTVKQQYIKMYNEFDGLSGYKDFIQLFNNTKLSGPNKKVSFSNMDVNKSSTDKQESDFAIELTDEQMNNLASAQYVVYRDNKDGYYRPIYSGGTAKINGNKLEATIKNKQLKVKSTNDESDEMIITMFEQSETEKYVTYYTLVQLQKFSTESISDWKHDSAMINIIFDKETKKVDVISTVYNDDDYPTAAIANVSDYDSVAFSAASGWTILDDDGNYVGPIVENGRVKGDGIVTGWEEKPGNYEFELAQFDNEYDYYCVFILTDIYGNKAYTKLVKMN